MNDTFTEIQLQVKTDIYAALEHMKDVLKDRQMPKFPPEMLVDDETRKKLDAALSDITASMYAAVAKHTEAIQKEIEDLGRLGASKMLSANLD
jgi:hypothetical protein